MEKLRPTYDLDTIKRAAASSRGLTMTTTAIVDAAQLGFNRAAIVETILTMTRAMFVKSMTTLADHRQWQDVYHVRADEFLLYVKFQSDVVTEFKLVSFKEK